MSSAGVVSFFEDVSDIVLSHNSSKVFDERTQKKGLRGLHQGVYERQAAPPFFRGPEIRPDAALLAVDKPGVSQQLQVMADGRLLLRKERRELADTHWLGLLHQNL